MRKIFFILLLLPSFSIAQIITTIAGTGISGYTGDGGPATSAKFVFPMGGVFDIHRNYFFVEALHVRKISPDGIITTVAGNDTQGFGGDGGPATSANFSTPTGVAVDTFGNLYISDLNNRIRKVNAGGIITTIAGNGTAGFSGDGGPATNAMISSPQYVCCDKAGNVYFSDAYNNRVRRVNSSGIINTIVGNGSVTLSNVHAKADTSSIRFPVGLCFDESNNLYIAEHGWGRIRKVDNAGFISTVAGNGSIGYSGDGGSATAAETRASYIAVDKQGNLYVSEINSGLALVGNRIRQVNATGIISTVAGTGVGGYNGDGGSAITAQLNNPGGVAVDSCGNLYIADNWNHRIRKVTFHMTCENLETKQKPITRSPSIYPNPTTDIVTVELAESISEISIINSIGQLVYHNTYSAKKAQINVTSLPRGIYILSINGVIIRKFIKQ